MTEMERSKNSGHACSGFDCRNDDAILRGDGSIYMEWGSSSQYKRLAETHNFPVKITDLEEINTLLAGRGHGSEGHDGSHIGWSYQNERLKGSCKSLPAECATHGEWFVGSGL